ncbi:MAG TPA: hypothetical protein VF793_07215 [Telluria sp.]|jgi:hypothetical protein
MSDVEGKILKMYDKSKPEDEDLYDISHVNQWAWSLVVVLVGVILWLCIALVTAENQRFALASGMCQDPVFPGTFDKQCLVNVHSRDHWWQHLWYAGTHILNPQPPAPNPPHHH